LRISERKNGCATETDLLQKAANGHVSKLKDKHFRYLLSEFECIFKAFKVFEFKLPVSEDKTKQ
jgi:hypothetical protein